LSLPKSRDLLIVSHANPEDNLVARWLTLRLANEGYRAWCDVANLLGGEIFWDEIQRLIKEETAKFLFVSSRTSNLKEGPLQELDCAKGTAKARGLKDFIIPLKIDDLPHNDVHIIIRRINSIPFAPSWPRGFAQLLDKLEEDGVPKNPNFNPAAVSMWWRNEVSATRGIIQQPDDHVSNWFPITLPELLYRHSIGRRTTGKMDLPTATLPWPAVSDSDISFVSFATAKDFGDSLGEVYFIDSTTKCKLADILAGTAHKEYPKHLSQLMRLAWENHLFRRSLPIYGMANHNACMYFKSDMVPNDKLFFDGVEGKSTWRAVVGYKTMISGKRYWHFGVTAKPVLRPEPHFVMKTHVLFSSDGKTIWSSPERLAKARRNQCKNWWNDEWRDRLLGTMAFLAVDGAIKIDVGVGRFIEIAQTSEMFQSSVSYLSPGELLNAGEDEDDEGEEEYGDDPMEDDE